MVDIAWDILCPVKGMLWDAWSATGIPRHDVQRAS